MRDAGAVHNIEKCFFKRRRNLIFDNLGLCPCTDNFTAGALDDIGLSDVDTDRGIKLQRPSARGDLGVAVNDADLFTKLIDKNNKGIALCDNTGKLA